jgi:hypothetical protein
MTEAKVLLSSIVDKYYQRVDYDALYKDSGWTDDEISIQMYLDIMEEIERVPTTLYMRKEVLEKWLHRFAMFHVYGELRWG